MRQKRAFFVHRNIPLSIELMLATGHRVCLLSGDLKKKKNFWKMNTRKLRIVLKQFCDFHRGENNASTHLAVWTFGWFFK